MDLAGVGDTMPLDELVIHIKKEFILKGKCAAYSGI